MNTEYANACAAVTAAAYAHDAACESFANAYNYGSPSELETAHLARAAAERAFWRAVDARNAVAETA